MRLKIFSASLMILTMNSGPVAAQQAEEWVQITTGHHNMAYGRSSAQQSERSDILLIFSRPGEDERSYVAERIHINADCGAGMIAYGDFTITSIPGGEVTRTGTYAGSERGVMFRPPRGSRTSLLSWICDGISNSSYGPLSYSDAVDVAIFWLSRQDQ